ncbi:MAG: hypothetical protein V1709_06005 [Planctomycetota bacterium]
MATVKAKAFFIIPEQITPMDDTTADWRDTTKNKASKADSHRKMKLPDEGAFQSKLAQASAQKFKKLSDVLDAGGYVSEHGRSGAEIGHMQEANLMEAFGKYETGWNYQFETVDGVEAKRYKEGVDKGTDSWSGKVAKTTFRLTGDIRALGVAPLTVLFLTGDEQTAGFLREGDQILEGGPVDVTRPGLRQLFRSGLLNKLVQAGVIIAKSKFDPDVILAANTVINDFIKGLQDAAFVNFQPAVDPAKSYCVFIRDGATFKLEIQVVTP